jgi:RNA polymerase sigma-70 factor (ECF subfamily)
LAAGPTDGLELIDALAEEWADYAPMYAAQADLLRRVRDAEAAVAYRSAIARTSNEAERAYLTRRLVELT